MRWSEALLAALGAWLWLRSTVHRRRLDRLDKVTGAWRTAEPAAAPADELEPDVFRRPS